jgi:outer membrane murein-binding lipoprotein Lpp
VRLTLAIAFTVAVVALAGLLGAWRDARATSSNRAATIAGLTRQVAQLEGDVARLRARTTKDEVTIARVQQRVAAICFRGHVVTDVAADTAGSVSKSFAYC